MSYYGDEYPKRRNLLGVIVLSLLSGLIGGLLAINLAPLVLGTDFAPNNSPQGQTPQGSYAPLPFSSAEDSPVVDIAERVGPTIVGVSNQGTSRMFFSRDLVEQGSGSGVIISDEGYIITNYHVIAKAERIMVNLVDGRQVQAEVRGSDPDTDLAVLKIKANNLPVAVLGDSEQLKVGELVVAIGNPLGYEFARSVTAGVLSAKEREITIEDRKFKLLQTDAAINPGNSGGALVNRRGEVIGINSVKVNIAGVEGMGFAIPISDAKPIIDELLEKGYISRPSLGIWGIAIELRDAQANGLPQGIYVREVIPGGGAQKAGLETEDIIIGINGNKIISFEELSAQIKNFKPGDKITINLWRKGKKIDLSLVLGERPRE